MSNQTTKSYLQVYSRISGVLYLRMIKKLSSIGMISILMLGACTQNFISESSNSSHLRGQDKSNRKHRLIVLTDIEADPDDTQSLIRLLLYSNEIDMKGLIATTSVWKKTSIAPESIKKVVQAYGKVQPNLERHEDGFWTGEFIINS